MRVRVHMRVGVCDMRAHVFVFGICDTLSPVDDMPLCFGPVFQFDY